MNPIPSDKPDLSDQAVTPSGRAVTIRDFARLVGVSPGTLSHATQNNPLVNKDTRQRFMEAVRELGYMPNLAVHGLALQRALTAAVLASFPATTYVANCLAGIAEAPG